MGEAAAWLVCLCVTVELLSLHAPAILDAYLPHNDPSHFRTPHSAGQRDIKPVAAVISRGKAMADFLALRKAAMAAYVWGD